MTHNMTFEYLREHGPRTIAWLGYGTWFTHTLVWLSWSKHRLLHWTCANSNPQHFHTLHTLYFPYLHYLLFVILAFHHYFYKPSITTILRTLSYTHTHSLIPLLVTSIVVRVINQTNYLEIEEPSILVGTTTPFLKPSLTLYILWRVCQAPQVSRVQNVSSEPSGGDLLSTQFDRLEEALNKKIDMLIQAQSKTTSLQVNNVVYSPPWFYCSSLGHQVEECSYMVKMEKEERQ